MEPTGSGIVIGVTNWRDRRRLIAVRAADRLQHVYAIVQTGAGRSTLPVNLMRQDAAAGRGVAFLDPHGDAVGELRAAIESSRLGQIEWCDPADVSRKVAFNPLEAVPPELRAVPCSGNIEAFRSVWGQCWEPRLEHFMRSALLTLLEQHEATLADVLRLFADERFRRVAVERVRHPPVRSFWLDEYARMSAPARTSALGTLRNKLGALLSEPSLYRVLTRPRSSFRPREVMDSECILLVNLSKGRLGPDASAMLGSLLVTGIAVAALSRSDTPERDRRDFYAYLHEFHTFHTFTTLSVATMLSELRK